MESQVTREIRGMPAKLAKAILIDLSMMDLQEVPLTAEDLEEFIAYNQGNTDYDPLHMVELRELIPDLVEDIRGFQHPPLDAEYADWLATLPA